MRITIALLLVATKALAHIGGPPPHNTTTNQEPWTPVQNPATITSKQDGADNNQQYLDPRHQILVITPDREAEGGAGASYTYQLPARGEVINTAPVASKDNPQPASPQGVDSQAMLQPAGSGVVLQIHPQYLKGYPPNQNVKPSQGGQTYNRNPQVAGSDVSLQIQPHFVVTGVHNPNLLHKQIQAPIYYNQALNSASMAVNYPNHLLGGARPGQQVLAQPNPAVLAQLAAAQYPQLFPATQHVKVQNHPLGTKAPPPHHAALHHQPSPHHQASPQHQATSPAGETKVRPHVRDTSSDEIFPDFGKMFESYFKTGGPFGQSFRNDNPENAEGTNLKINTNDDFPTGDFFGDLDKTKSATTNQQQKQQHQHSDSDSGFQPCDFFKSANQKVVDNSEEDSEQFSSDKHAAREKNHPFGSPRGGGYEDRPNPSRPKNHGERERYRGDDDSEEDDDKPRHRQENRNHDDEDEEDRPQRYRPSQSQKSQSYRGRESDEEDDEGEQRRPANFHHHHTHDARPSSHSGRQSNDHHGRPSSQNQSSGGYHGNNSGRQEHNSGSDYGRPSHDHNSGRQEHNSGGYHGNNSGRKEQNSGRKEQNSGSYQGRPSQEHNSGRQHSGRPTNQRPSSEESRPSYGRHHNDDDDDSGETRGRPSGQYRQGQTSNRHPQEAKPPVRTFHSYNFPPAPDYSREAPQEKRRPPPPVKEPDTLAYYSYVTPVVGNSGVYYRSEKEILSRNNTMSIE